MRTRATSASSSPSSRASPTSRAAPRQRRPPASPTHAPAIWPIGALDRGGHVSVGGVTLTALAERFGTPLYVYDARSVREAYRAYRAAFRGGGPVRISYSLKACPLIGVATLLARAGAGASAASVGEVLAALRAGFPAGRIQLHGNAKTDDDLRRALRLRLGRIVVDGAHEIEALARLTARSRPQAVWLRVSPGISADTHPHLRTGALDSKFGAPVTTGAALAQAEDTARVAGLRLVGVHAHLGTELRDSADYAELARVLVAFARQVRERTGAPIGELAVGGGLAIPLRPEDRTLDLGSYASAVLGPIRADPVLGRAVLYVEPGRSLVGRAGVALYRVVGTKRVEGVRTFVSVDGGMGDNIRPALYGAAYSAVLPERADATAEEEVALAGKYCESGDVLIRSVPLPLPRAGELVAIPAAGAYALAMASNYNHYPRPAAVLVDRGGAQLIRRRERMADLWRLEA